MESIFDVGTARMIQILMKALNLNSFVQWK